MIFVNSMSDLFQEAVPDSFVAEVWRVMAATPQHTYQILTKRPERMALATQSLPLLSNVWLGASVESAAYFERLDHLRRARGTLRFVSLEPLLGSVAGVDLSLVDWAIVGGESGPGARPMNPDWVREIRAACLKHGTAFFFKQWGGKNKKKTGRILDGKTWSDLPERRATP
jgi:protein gp37